MSTLFSGDVPIDKALLMLLAGAAFKITALQILARKHRRLTTKVRVGTLSQITVYPVKSLKGSNVTEASCETSGLVAFDHFRDRSLMVCNDKTYSMVTGRQHPKLVLIKPTVEGQTLRLEAESMDPLIVQLSPDVVTKGNRVQTSVWGQPIEAYDCGDTASSWLSKYLGTTSVLRLVYHSPDLQRRLCSDGETPWHKLSTPSDQVVFQDGFPYMMMSESSVEELNQRLPGGKVASMSQFRPNFVVTGSAAFDEDSWNELYIGDAVFSNIKPCSRCIFTTVNTVEGKKDEHKEPLMTLRSYRMTEPILAPSPCIGINLVLKQSGTAREGDEIWVTFKY